YRRVKGAPSKLTPAMQAEIVALVEAGNYIETAAAVCGIRKQTIYDWLKKGARQERGKYHDFNRAIRAAQAKADAADLAIIAEAARNGAWQAAGWRLERRNPRHFALTQRIEHSGRDGKPITATIAAGIRGALLQGDTTELLATL